MVRMDRGQATASISSKCNLVSRHYKDWVSPDRVNGANEDVVNESHVAGQVRRWVIRDSGEKRDSRKRNKRVWVFNISGRHAYAVELESELLLLWNAVPFAKVKWRASWWCGGEGTRHGAAITKLVRWAVNLSERNVKSASNARGWRREISRIRRDRVRREDVGCTCVEVAKILKKEVQVQRSAPKTFGKQLSARAMTSIPMLCPLNHRYYKLYASLIRLGLATRSDPLHPYSPGTSSLQITSATPHEDAICYILTRFLAWDGQTKVGRNTWRFKHCSRQAKERKTTSGSKGFKFMICTSKVAIFEVTFGPHSNIILRFRACSSGPKPARVVRLWY